MALVAYNGPAGQFNYDDSQFAVSSENGLLQYIGSEIRGENINIPQGIKNCSGMFKNSIIMTAPVIPNGVENISEMFANCQQLQNYPVIPNTVYNKSLCFAGSTFDPTRNNIEQDSTIKFINADMNNEIDDILYNWQNENIHIEEAFSYEGNYEKTQKQLINNELRTRMAIAEARMDGLVSEENHIETEIARQRSMGAPSNYMEDTLRIKSLQINNLQQEISNIRAELKYRNPSVFDIIKANAVEHKQNLLSIGQKITNGIIKKVDNLRQSASTVKGNIYRAAELAQLKFDQKILATEKKLNEKDIERTSKIYNKIVPGICAVSTKINNIKESLKAFKANLDGKDYQVKTGLTDTGKKLVESMYNTMASKVSRFTETEGELEKVKLKIDIISHNLSPMERRQSIDIIQNISQKLSEITQSARDASQEKISSYEKIKDAQENNHVTAYEKEMTAEEIVDRYPAAIRNVERYYATDNEIVAPPGKNPQNPSEQIGQYLFNEIPHNEVIYTSEEKNQMIERTLNNISSSGNRSQEHEYWQVHVKEDHAEVLKSSSTPSVMDTYEGQTAMNRYEAQKESGSQERKTTGLEESRG